MLNLMCPRVWWRIRRRLQGHAAQGRVIDPAGLEATEATQSPYDGAVVVRTTLLNGPSATRVVVLVGASRAQTAMALRLVPMAAVGPTAVSSSAELWPGQAV